MENSFGCFSSCFMSNAVHQAAKEIHKLPKAEEKQSYQWLHTQAVRPDTDSTGTGR